MNILPTIDPRCPLEGVEISPTIIAWQLANLPICLGCIGGFRSLAAHGVGVANQLEIDGAKSACLAGMTKDAWCAFLGIIHPDIFLFDYSLRALRDEVSEKIDAALGVKGREENALVIKKATEAVTLQDVVMAENGGFAFSPQEDSDEWLAQLGKLKGVLNG